MSNLNRINSDKKIFQLVLERNSAMKISLFFLILFSILLVTSAQEEGGGYTDTPCKPLPPG